MKFVKPVLSIGLVSLMLMGCGTTTRDNNLATDNNTRPMGVRYNSQDNRDFYDNRVGMNDYRTGTNVGTNNRFGTNVGMNNRDHRIDVADNIADRVKTLKEVDDAHVLVTNRNAYVAVKLNRSARNELTSTLEKKVAHEVRAADKNIDHVYVSENAEFYEHVHRYRTDLQAGRPVSGFYNRFTETINRLFPTAR
jgi:spore cortex protein